MRLDRLIMPLLVASVVLWASPSWAQCPALPYALTNGQIADATQVTANFNALVNCIGANGGVTSGTAGQVAFFGTTGNVVSGTSLSSLLDSSLGSTQGSILYRGATGWATLSPGINGYVLQAQGPSANPTWVPPSGRGSLTLFDISAGVPSLSTFTTVNVSGNVTASERPGVALMVQSQGQSFTNATVSGIYTAAPITPYRVAILVAPTLPNAGFNAFQFGFTDGIKFETLRFQQGTVLTHENYTNSSTRAAVVNVSSPPGISVQHMDLAYVWIGLRDDGANIYIEWSMDGANFNTMYTTAKSTGFLGASGYSNVFVGITSDTGLSTNLKILETILCFDPNGLARHPGGI